MHRTFCLLLAASVVLAAAPEQPPEPAKPPVPRLVQQVPPDLAEPILGRQVMGPGDKEVGRLVDVLIDATGEPQAAVIDFGGFLGVGNRRIAVRWDTLHFAPADPHRPIHLDMTLDEIKAAPSYNDTSKPAQVVTPEPAPAAEAATKSPAADAATKSPAADAATKPPAADAATKSPAADAATKSPAADAATKSPADAATKPATAEPPVVPATPPAAGAPAASDTQAAPPPKPQQPPRP